MRTFSKTLRAGLSGLTLLIAQQAAAQTGSAPDTTQSVAPSPAYNFEDIVVTANRREENLQKVPLSVSVLQTDNLTAAGVTNPLQLQLVTTNVQVGNLNAKPLIYIRGMGTSNLGPGSEGPVGFYQDGVYVPFTMSFDQSFIDIQRVEVLKGPQGTLYGRNTTAGAVNLITRDPSDERTVETRLSLGTWGSQQLQAYASSGPGRVAASIAGNVTRHNAYLKNLGTGPDSDDRKEVGLRGKVKFEMSEDWTATLSAGYNRRRDHNQWGFLSLTDRPVAADPAQGGRFTTMKTPRRFYSNFPTYGQRFREYDLSLNIRGDLGFADFASISGYRNHKSSATADNDASDLALSQFAADVSLKNWSQEFQLISNSDSALEWIAGLYYFHSKGGFENVQVFNPGNNAAPTCCSTKKALAGTAADLLVISLGKAEAYAAYGQASYSIIDGLKLTAGARYSRERRTLINSSVIIPGLGVVATDPRESVVFKSFDPKAGIEYSWGRQMIYGSFTRGFRSGGYNIGSPGQVGPVRPEKVSAFEIGGKHTVVPGVLFNWAAFHYNYKQLQVSIVQNDGAGSLFTTQNAASAKIKGAEAELTVNAIQRVSFRAGVGYTDAKYKRFENASAYLPVPGGYGFAPAQVDISGRPLNRAPKWTATSQLTYTLPVGDDNIDLDGNVFYTGSYYLDTASDVHQKRFALINLRATYRLSGDKLSAGIFVTNLTNKVYLLSHSTTASVIAVTPSDPRIIGASISLKY